MARNCNARVTDPSSNCHRRYTDVTDGMMLAALPGRVGDGSTPTVKNTLTTAAGVTTSTTAIRIGAVPGANPKRFWSGRRSAGSPASPRPAMIARCSSAPSTRARTAMPATSPRAGRRRRRGRRAPAGRDRR